MNGIEILETFFASGKIGAVCVPLNWRLVPDELEFILNDSGTSTLVYGTELASAAADPHGRATMDADGFVTIMDRVKDLLISGGENVYPAEIENIILANPKVVRFVDEIQRNPGGTILKCLLRDQFAGVTVE